MYRCSRLQEKYANSSMKSVFYFLLKDSSWRVEMSKDKNLTLQSQDTERKSKMKDSGWLCLSNKNSLNFLMSSDFYRVCIW
jgi:hypothetical protein